MRKRFVWLMVAFLLSGCIKSKEHLKINADGSGQIESEILVPAGTTQLIDMMAGSFQAMAEGMGATPPPVESMAKQMFASREAILEKAQKANVDINILEFDYNETDDGMHVKYKIEFSDVSKFIESGISSGSLEISKNESGNWVCRSKKNPEQASQSQAQATQFEDFQNSDEFQNMDPMMRQSVVDAMSNLEIEFLVSMPFPIKEISGMFEKMNEQTARLYISGDLLRDPSIIEKMSGVSGESSVEWDLQAPVSNTAYDLGGMVKVFMQNGETFEGRLEKDTEKYIVIEMFEVKLTFYKNEIKKIE